MFNLRTGSYAIPHIRATRYRLVEFCFGQDLVAAVVKIMPGRQLQGQHAACADRPSSIAQPSHRQGADIPLYIPSGNKVTQAQLFNGLLSIFRGR